MAKSKFKLELDFGHTTLFSDSDWTRYCSRYFRQGLYLKWLLYIQMGFSIVFGRRFHKDEKKIVEDFLIV
jgi:hypothetical protein